MTATTLAVARFTESLASALNRLAIDLQGASLEAREVGALEPAPIADLDEQSLGKRQREIVALPDLATEEGLKTGEIARQIDYDQPNAYTTLGALQRAGLVELVPGAQPQRWRLTARYRSTADPYMRMARYVQSGEWTTYGDLSIAVRGDNKAARAVGRAAATLQAFPNPHRVLKEGGVSPPGWHDSDGQGPDECRRRLKDEGVGFTEDGRADQARRVTWDVLVERSEADTSSEQGV